MPRKIVFISYSHDSDEHREKVLALSERLRQDGLETRLDQYVNGTPAQTWPRWMLDQLDEAGSVLVVCTETYYRRFRGHEEPGKGKGVDWEGAIITQELYDARSTTLKFVPVMLESGLSSFIPEPLRGLTHYTLTSEPSYQSLYDFLLGQAGVEPGEVGDAKTKSRPTAEPLTFDGKLARASGLEPPRPEPRSVASKRLSARHWNVPNRNDYFTGREAELAGLKERLQAAGAAALTQAITGLGGVGKTQIAIEFCHRHRKWYEGGVYWADASSAEALTAAYRGFAVAHGLASKDEPAEDAAAQFLHSLSGAAAWLLVLDNADTPHEVRPLFPTTATGHVIVTSRARLPGFGRDPTSVDVWPLEQATEFLMDRAARPGEDTAARELADALGCLPLALEQAGAYMANVRAPVAEYLASFRKRHLDLVEEWAPEQGKYYASVATTWNMSFQEVEAASPAAAEALRACAYLAPDGIPLELFVGTGDGLGSNLGLLAKEAAEDPLLVHKDLVEPLTRYSLATFDPADGGKLSVHRLVQEVIRRQLKSEDLGAEVFERVHRGVDACFPQDPGAPASWGAGALWLPHVQSLFAVWRGSPELGPDPTALWTRVGWYAWAAGFASAARELHEQALSVRRRVLGEEHSSTLTSMGHLALTLSDLGDASGARELHEEALSVRRRVLGEEHPDTLTSMNNLATTLSDLGDASGARELLEEALSVRRRVLGEEHPDTLSSMNNLALTLRDLGDASGARELFEEAHRGYGCVLGEEHPWTLTAMNNLCALLEDSDGMEADPQMVATLVAGVKKLPERTPVRVAVEARWPSSSSEDSAPASH